MRQTDDLLNTWLPDGSLRSEAVAGTNQGLRVLYRFAGSATLTVAQRALSKAFEEDRRDLESGAYARYRARTADGLVSPACGGCARGREWRGQSPRGGASSPSGRATAAAAARRGTPRHR